MGIFSRTRDIIAANVTDLLDKAEDPAKRMSSSWVKMRPGLVKSQDCLARQQCACYAQELPLAHT